MVTAMDKVTDQQVDAVRESVENPITIYADYNDELTEEQIELALKGDMAALEEALYENLFYDYIYETRRLAVKNAFSKLDVDLTDRETSEVMELTGIYPMIQVDVKGYIRNTRTYLGLTLKLQHPRQEWHGTHLRHDNPEIAKVLETFHINPRDMQQALQDIGITPDELPWPDIDRGDSIIEPKELAQAWLNSPYGGQYVVMLDTFTLRDIVNIDKTQPIKLRRARLIIHDFFNGASSTSFFAKDPLVLPTDVIGEFYNDKALKYGVQSCCAFAGDAWQTRVEQP